METRVGFQNIWVLISLSSDTWRQWFIQQRESVAAVMRFQGAFAVLFLKLPFWRSEAYLRAWKLEAGGLGVKLKASLEEGSQQNLSLDHWMRKMTLDYVWSVFHKHLVWRTKDGLLDNIITKWSPNLEIKTIINVVYIGTQEKL